MASQWRRASPAWGASLGQSMALGYHGAPETGFGVRGGAAGGARHTVPPWSRYDIAAAKVQQTTGIAEN